MNETELAALGRRKFREYAIIVTVLNAAVLATEIGIASSHPPLRVILWLLPLLLPQIVGFLHLSRLFVFLWHGYFICISCRRLKDKRKMREVTIGEKVNHVCVTCEEPALALSRNLERVKAIFSETLTNLTDPKGAIRAVARRMRGKPSIPDPPPSRPKG